MLILGIGVKVQTGQKVERLKTAGKAGLDLCVKAKHRKLCREGLWRHSGKQLEPHSLMAESPLLNHRLTQHGPLLAQQLQHAQVLKEDRDLCKNSGLYGGIEQHKRADINDAVGIFEEPIVYTELADAVNKELKRDWDTVEARQE
ncbi:uncharacterized protein LOC120046944 isoform X2 [Scomber scombrus]|uniref:Uncharacterized protein LOC120046944 isoform X2 n=1 Tax=Scomber scombrus TaxID=13677 RepID=A0AAV1N8I1_SCOSC